MPKKVSGAMSLLRRSGVASLRTIRTDVVRRVEGVWEASPADRAHRFCRSKARDGIVVARDARRIRHVGECLPTPRAVGETKLVGAYPPSVRRERSSGTGDEGA